MFVGVKRALHDQQLELEMAGSHHVNQTRLSVRAISAFNLSCAVFFQPWLLFDTKSHVFQASLEFLVLLKITSFWSSYLHLSSIGTAGLNHQA